MKSSDAVEKEKSDLLERLRVLEKYGGTSFESERVSQLEAEVESLKREVTRLEAELCQVRKGGCSPI